MWPHSAPAFVMGRESALQHVAARYPVEPTVLVCAVEPSQRARLTDALRARANIVSVDLFSQLMRGLRGTVDHVDAVVLGVRDASGADAAATVREIADERPRIAMVAYCQAGVQYSSDIRALAAAGVHQFVFAGIDDHGVTFRAVLAAAQRHCAAEFIARRITPLLPSALHSVAVATLARPDIITSVPALARVLGVHRKTLFNRCARAGLMSPAELMTWLRLAMVAYLLDNTGCTVETIALELSFASDTALRNTIKRYTGRRATEIRQRGALSCVVDGFRARLRGDAARPQATLHLV